MTDAEANWAETSPVVEPLTAGGLRKSLFLSFLDRYSRIAIRFASMAILARLLTPKEYGVFTIGWVIISVTQALRDFGVMSFLIQEKTITRQLIQTAFGISLAIGGVIVLVIVPSSGWIAAFYGDETVRSVLLVLSANFILMPFSSIIMALLRREMRFGALYVINVAAASANAIVAVACAFLSFGAMSLAWGSIGSVATASILALAVYPEALRMLPSLREWRRVTSFGVVATCGTVISTLGLQAPQLIIGRLLSLGAVGMFGRADSLVSTFDELVTTSIAPVAVAAIAQWHRTETNIRAGFLRAMALMTAIAWPFYAFASLMAFPLVHILYGNEWNGAVNVARILCLSGALLAMSNLNSSVFQGRGEVKKLLRMQLIVQPATIALVIPAAFFNLKVVAVAIVAASAFKVIISYRLVHRLIDVSLVDIMKSTVKSLGVSVTTAVAPSLVLFFLLVDDKHIWLPFALSAAGATAGWVLGAAVLRHPVLDELKPILRRLRGTMRSRGSDDGPAEERQDGVNVMRYLKGTVSNFHRPGPRPDIFIFATPRSGSTFLLELLHAQPRMKLYNEPISANRSACRRELGVRNWDELTIVPNREERFERYFNRLRRNEVKELNPPLYRRYARLLTNRIVFKVINGAEDMVGWFATTYDAKIVILIRHPIPTALSHQKQPRLHRMLQQPQFRALFSESEIAYAETIIESGTMFEKGILSWCLQMAGVFRKPIDPDWAIISYEDLTVFPETSFAYLRDKLQLDPIDGLEKLCARPSLSTDISDPETRNFFATAALQNDRVFLIEKWKKRVSSEDERRAFAICAAMGVHLYEFGSLFPAAAYRVPGMEGTAAANRAASRPEPAVAR